MTSSSSPQLIDRVIEGGYCVGCGACAALDPDSFALDFTETGMFTARACRPAAARSRDLSTLCPMSGAGADETALAAELYPAATVHDRIGRHAMTTIGHVVEGDWRAAGSSGGLLSWLSAELLARGLVEEVIEVGPSQEREALGAGRPELFAFRIARSPEEARANAKSRYYPVQARDAIAHLRDSGKATLFVGLPCFVKTLRLVAREDAAVARNLRFTLGLVCGHLKSAAFGELLAWQAGVPPELLETVDFRVKLPDWAASDYGFGAVPKQGEPVVRKMYGLVGQNWGHGMMKYKACDFCDDVLAETADIAVGDAWLDPWRKDWQGTNAIVVRHPEIVALLEEAQAVGRLHLEPVGPDVVAKTQDAGLRHRREGLEWRLWSALKRGDWVPKRRVDPQNRLPRALAASYAARERIRDDSHAAFLAARAEGRLERFVTAMQPSLAAYDHARRPPLARRLRGRIGRLLRRIGLRQVAPRAQS